MRIILAPMQGVLDGRMRQILTEFNHYDLCVSEFVRINQSILSAKAFYNLCPELKPELSEISENSQKSVAPTPLRVQLLGQDPNYLAENTAVALKLGSSGIDLNCGCPAKSVNNNHAGATLLKQPELIYQALTAMRSACENDILSVKIRLGYNDDSLFNDIIAAAYNAKADEICIHARLKVDNYQADKINWDKINTIDNHIKQRLRIIVNGEILDQASALAAQQHSGCVDIMVARGALITPNLSKVIKYGEPAYAWTQIKPILLNFMHYQQDGKNQLEYYQSARLKQWLRFLELKYPQAKKLFQQIRKLKNLNEITTFIFKS